MRLGLLIAGFGLFMALRQDAAPVSAEAQYRLGRAHQTGKGAKKDPAQAEYWYWKAAASGDTRGQRALEDLEPSRAWAESHGQYTRLELCPSLGSVPYCQGSPR
jgi:TPR repeat protein